MCRQMTPPCQEAPGLDCISASLVYSPCHRNIVANSRRVKQQTLAQFRACLSQVAVTLLMADRLTSSLPIISACFCRTHRCRNRQSLSNNVRWVFMQSPSPHHLVWGHIFDQLHDRVGAKVICLGAVIRLATAGPCRDTTAPLSTAQTPNSECCWLATTQ